jgi:hypothetical protein
MKHSYRELAAIVERLRIWQNTEESGWPEFRLGPAEYKSTAITQYNVFGLTNVLVAEISFR